jgi:hypothetical protein
MLEILNENTEKRFMHRTKYYYDRDKGYIWGNDVGTLNTDKLYKPSRVIVNELILNNKLKYVDYENQPLIYGESIPIPFY